MVKIPVFPFKWQNVLARFDCGGPEPFSLANS
jgi:hypothetical protein